MVLLWALLGLLLAAGAFGVWKRLADPGRWIDLRVMCFNIRQGMAKDGENNWEFRKDLVCDVIREDAPDVAGLQEVYRFQLDHLLECLPQYSAVGTGRDGGTKGEYAPILYRTDRFDVAGSGTFWLSDTPALPSASWGNNYRRLCTWVRLVDRRTRQAFAVYNTHLDHQSQEAREKGVRLIMQTIASRPDPEPFVLCGDFNSGENSEVIAYLRGSRSLQNPNPIPLLDSWRVAHPENPECGTGSRFTGSMDPVKVDYIMTTPDTEVLSSRINRTNRDGRYPSDHYPVHAHLMLPSPPLPLIR